MTERASARKAPDRKAPDAFRTIGEVAEAMGLPTHVLRFWESRFPQIRPVKGAGGRRYYRPTDVALITALRRLLHEDGLSIRAHLRLGYRLLRESVGGVRLAEQQVSSVLGQCETGICGNEPETVDVCWCECLCDVGLCAGHRNLQG